MTVPVPKRKLSGVQYIETARKLNVEIGHIVANGPKKYLNTYGDRIVNLGLAAYEAVIEANSIYPSKGVRAEQDYLQRRALLLKARGKVKALAAVAKIYFDLLVEAKGLQKMGEETDEKIASRAKQYARMDRLGCLCDEEIRLIQGVLKSDTEKFKKYNGQ